MRRQALRALVLGFTGAALLLAARPAWAQGVPAGGGGGRPAGGGGAGGAGGSSAAGGSFGGGSFGTSSLGSSFSGGFGMSGGTGFSGGFSGSAAPGGASVPGRAGTIQYGMTSPIGRYLGSPLAIGWSGGSPVGTTAQTQLWYQRGMTFGQPIYQATGAVGTGIGTLNTGGLGGGIGTGLGTNIRPFGASSAGVRVAPAYTTALAFPLAPPRAPEVMRTDLQDVLARSGRLTSRGSIRVVMDGRTVVLRGSAATAREKRLAESLVRLTPGVRDVRNEIVAPGEPTAAE